MKLEPGLVARIRRERRRRLAFRLLALTTLAAVIALVLILVVIPYLAGNTTFSPLVHKTSGAGGVVVLLLVAVALDLVFALLYVPGIIRDRSFFAVLTRRAQKFDAVRLGTCMNALDGARLEAGMDEPGLAVLASQQPNALTFERRGQPVIGITRGLLDAGLSYAETEAVMAHELGSIITGDYLRRPGARLFDTTSYVMLALFSLLGMSGAAMARAGRSVWVGVAFLAVAGLILFLEGFLLRRIIGPREHDYLLSDSIAANVTGKPEALAGAIRRLDGIVNGRSRGRFPDNEFGLKHLFVVPYRWREGAEAFVQRRHSDLNWNSSATMKSQQVEGVQSAMDELAEWAETLLAGRLANLKDG